MQLLIWKAMGVRLTGTLLSQVVFFIMRQVSLAEAQSATSWHMQSLLYFCCIVCITVSNVVNNVHVQMSCKMNISDSVQCAYAGKNYQFKETLQQQLKAGMQSLLTCATPAEKSTATYCTSHQALQKLTMMSLLQ